MKRKSLFVYMHNYANLRFNETDLKNGFELDNWFNEEGYTQ